MLEVESQRGKVSEKEKQKLPLGPVHQAEKGERDTDKGNHTLNLTCNIA